MGVIKRNGNTYGGGGGASADGKAESSAIAPVFDDTATYAAGDRVMYEDELYVFNTAHTGAWDAADADKSDVDSEIPDKLTSQQMQEIKDAFVVDSPRNGYPVLFDETGAEHFIGWYKYADGTKKPVYRKDMSITSRVSRYDTLFSNIDILINYGGYGIYRSSNSQIRPFPWVGSAEHLSSVYIENGSVKYDTVSTIDTLEPGSKIWFLYTKTTDTPQ